jgi:hypothetical protein
VLSSHLNVAHVFPNHLEITALLLIVLVCYFEKMAFASQTRFGIIPNQVEGCYMLLG